jgi:hypothetical protein
MILFIAAWCLAFLGAVWCPDTALGRWLHRALIQIPAGLLNPDNRFKFILTVAACVVTVALVLGAPELLPVFVLGGDLTAYLEIATIVWLLGASLRINGLRSTVARAIRRAGLNASISRIRLRAARRVRRHRPPKRPGSGKDGEPGWGWALA